MADSHARLLAELDALVAFLDSYSERHWSRWFRQARAEIAAGDRNGPQCSNSSRQRRCSS